MTVMYSFCLWFPVRLGSVLVGISASAQNLAVIIACILGSVDYDKTAKDVSYWLQHYDFLIAHGFMTAFKEDPSSFLTGFIVLFSIILASCTFLIYGAYRCNLWLIYPFVGLDLLRMLILTFLLILGIFVVKVNTLSIGYVIACSIGGGFFMLYLWYQWFCVVSLCQIIRYVEHMEETSQPSYKIIYPKRHVKNNHYSNKTFSFGIYSNKPQNIGLPKIAY